jgi:hypothetical protein
VTSVSPDHAGTGTTSVTITGTNFNDTTAIVTVNGSGVTVGAVTVDSPTQITTSFTIASNALQGPRDVSVEVFGKTGTGTAVFTVDSYLTVTAPSAINLGYMTAGATKTGSSGTAGTVASNYATWSVNAIDAKGTATGYMNTQADGSGTSLAAMFQIGKESGTYNYADAQLGYSGAPTSLPFYVSQAVASNAAAGNYQITITFTGSGS